MEGLLRRLSSDGSEAENALRVIAFFDRLVEARGGIEELVRSSARLIGAPAGFGSDADLYTIGFNDRGRTVPGAPPQNAVVKPVTVDAVSYGWVWIDGSSENVFLVELVAERMAMAAATILSRASSGAQTEQSTALERVLSVDLPREERLSAARLLGFRPEWNVRVAALQTTKSLSSITKELGSWASTHGLKASAPQLHDKLVVALVHDPGPGMSVPSPSFAALTALGSRQALGDAAASFETARQALQLTSELLGPRFIDYESLGPLTHLSALSPDQAEETVLVKKLTFLARSETGTAELLALDAFCQCRSLRTAAAKLNLHHSSLANRLKNASRKLELDLDDPSSLFQLSVSLQLYRIAVSGR